MTKKSAFIVTKPLQYINATNIPDENLEKDCLLCDNFDNVEEFQEIILKKSKHWHKVCVFSNKYKALLFVIQHKSQYNTLYLDSDLGIILTIFLYFTKPMNIYTYEEGYASYVNIRNHKTFKNKLAHVINKILRNENYSGGNVMTKGMFIYDVELFRKNIKPLINKPIYSFKKPFFEHFTKLDEIQYMYSLIEDKLNYYNNVVIYLSSWQVSPDIINIISKYDNYYKILKLHPNIKKETNVDKYFDFTIPNNYVIEYFITKKLESGANVIVIHHGSFAMHYIKGYKNLNEVII